MDLNYLRDYLISFNLSSEIIDSFLDNKKIFLKFNQIYLVDKGFSGKKVFDSNLIFIQLEKLLPSKFLLDFILKNTPNKVNLRSREVVLKLVYGKTLPRGIDYGVNFENDKRYILDYYSECISVHKIENDNFINEFNIGEYLKESN